MPSPKLLLITLDYPPQRGGVARYLSNLVQASKGQIRVSVDTPTLPFFRSSWPRWWPLVRLCRTRARPGEILLVSHVVPVGTAALISRLLGGPEYIVLMHGLDLRLVSKSFWKRWLVRQICQKARLLLVNSQATQHDVEFLIPAVRAHVLLPAVETIQLPTRQAARAELQLDATRPLVLSLARLVSRKGIDVALEALASLQRDQDVDYVVLGDGPDRERLQNLAKKYQTFVRWIPRSTDQEKWLWLAAADIFLLPARDEGNDVEGFGIVFLEAALAALPAVAGNSGGVGEAVLHEQTGLLLDPKNVEEMAQALSRLLKDPILREQLGQAARRRVLTEFQWSDRWGTLESLLS